MSNMNRNEKIKRLMPLAMLLIAFLSLVAAIIVLVSAASADASYKKVLLRISAVLFFVLVGLALYYFYLTRESDPNFFLFDQTTRKNVPVDQLTFGIVNERMDFYLSLISDSDEELWQGGVLAKNDGSFGREDVYRPLVAYKMLYDLTDRDDDVQWRLLEFAEVTTIRLLTRALKQGGDADMAQAIVELYRGEGEEGENLRDFLKGNQKYLRGRMLRYVKQHLDYFY
ncbi:MAG: hypothetical protein E7605_05275 [Ruminococcaceae bacterium]|nr:hypothetical protein [Oscillospiraceae bacterium]